jgi:hypothetical protein
MDLLIDSHCHLIRSTRSLLAWGTTLQVAVACLDLAPAAVVVERLSHLAKAGLYGSEEHHLGAPRNLNITATRIAERVAESAPDRDPPMLSAIYIAALQQLTRTDCDTLREAYERMRPALLRQ